jgi:hypothetical protein
MKLIHLIFAVAIGVCADGLAPPAGVGPRSGQTPDLGRREILNTAASLTLSAGALLVPQAAFAADYVPKRRDMEQIYQLGVSLDRLMKKVQDPDQLEAALSGVKQFNKDPNFYTGYAKNFIMKTVKKGSDSDPRVGYVKQVSVPFTLCETNAIGGGQTRDAKLIFSLFAFEHRPQL